MYHLLPAYSVKIFAQLRIKCKVCIIADIVIWNQLAIMPIQYEIKQLSNAIWAYMKSDSRNDRQIFIKFLFDQQWVHKAFVHDWSMIERTNCREWPKHKATQFNAHFIFISSTLTSINSTSAVSDLDLFELNTAAVDSIVWFLSELSAVDMAKDVSSGIGVSSASTLTALVAYKTVNQFTELKL